MSKYLQPLVSVIIPTLNRSDLLESCISSFVDTVIDIHNEIIVVDDGSNEEEKEKIRDLASRYGCKLIEMPTRQSYAKAINAGLNVAAGYYMLLLNNDVAFPHKGWLQRIVKTAETARNIGIVGCRLLYPDGTIQHAGGMLLQDERYDHRYRGKPGDFPNACLNHDVASVTAALMLIKREVLLDIGPLSEDYLLSYEDLDFCLRARQRGWRVIYCGKAVAIHHEGSTRGRSREEKPTEWYAEEIQSHITFWNRWRDFFSIRPLHHLSLIFLLSKRYYIPSDQKIVNVVAGLGDHGCNVHVEKIADLGSNETLASISNQLQEREHGVIFTNDRQFYHINRKNSSFPMPLIVIGRSHWYRYPYPEDIHAWINLASQLKKSLNQ